VGDVGGGGEMQAASARGGPDSRLGRPALHTIPRLTSLQNTYPRYATPEALIVLAVCGHDAAERGCEILRRLRMTIGA